MGVMVLWPGLSVDFFSFFRLSLFNVLVFLAIRKIYRGNWFFFQKHGRVYFYLTGLDGHNLASAKPLCC